MILKELFISLSNAEEKLRTQTGSIPKAYELQRQIVMASKEGIEATSAGAHNLAESAETQMFEAWQELGEVDLPASNRAQFDLEASQELVEALYVISLFPYIKGVMEKLELPSYISYKEIEGMHIPIQGWLFGLADVPGELSKMTDNLFLSQDLTSAERIAIRTRLIAVIQDIYDYLESCLHMKRISESIRSAGARKGYGNTFRGRLGRVRGILLRQKTILLELLERAQFLDEMRAIMRPTAA